MHIHRYVVSSSAKKLYSGSSTRSDTNRSIHPQKKARTMKFGYKLRGNCAKGVAKTKELISCAVTSMLISEKFRFILQQLIF